MSLELAGKGIEYTVKDDCIVFRVMRGAELGVSGSGKSITIGTTSGAIQIAGLQVNINVYKPNPDYIKGSTPTKAKKLAGKSISIND